METTEKPINLKDFEFELDNDEGELSIIVRRYNGKDEYITIPGYINGLQVKEIGYGAFENNNKIKKIIIEKGVTVIDYNAFSNCSELTEVELPEGLLKIGSHAFDGCEKLAKIQFPESIQIINYLAFQGCEKFTKVFIPKDVQDLGDSTFANCRELKEIIVDDENLDYSSMDGIFFNKAKTLLLKYPEAKKGASYIIPDTVNHFDNLAFINCRELISVNLPKRFCCFDLRTTFAGSNNLEQIIAHDDNPVFTTIDGVLFDKERKTLIFYPCGKKESEYKIPDGIDRIGKYAFQSCKNLKAVTFPESLRMIEEYAFTECENLSSIILPENLKGICNHAFTNCKQLKKVSLAQKTIIRQGVFEDCPNLETVTLSKKTKIGYKAFEGFKGQFVYRD
jgi:hypothetical protein